MKVLAQAPGRVNLIGDHTDYMGGLVLPMAIDLGTSIELDRGVPWIELVSDAEPDPAVVMLDDLEHPGRVQPPWARYVAGVAATIRPAAGGRGFIRTTLPIGAGLSSSAAFEVALALALGFEGSPLELALACQQAEHLAAGVPCGIMDQLTAAAGVEGHALLMDCTSYDVQPVPVPEGAQVVVVDSGQRRTLTTSHYGVRRTQAEEAATVLGLPLRDASPADVEGIGHDDLRRRARHVVSENARVRAAAAAMQAGDVDELGRLMNESHASLRDDFEVSTRVLDDLVVRLRSVPGVRGARLTGAGFGGCVVAVLDEGAEIPTGIGANQWTVRAAAGASITILEEQT